MSSDRFLLMWLIALLSPAALAAGEEAQAPSTDDLLFLEGDWIVERIYEPGTERERSHQGALTCAKDLDEQFVGCGYYFDRPGRAPINDRVYFNYNPIYGVYESLWLSATWPIKVLMSATPSETPSNTLVWEADFLIEDGVHEWVRSTWRLEDGNKFSRRTDIRTSRDPEGEWIHWMDETAARAD